MSVCGYVRLSRDENKENYDSIITQKQLIEDYANTMGIEIDEFFEDDGISGYYFDSERPAFQKLIHYIKEAKISIIFAKDLSRIGRHNAYTLLFLDLLKQHNVRLILVSDRYDSSKDNDDIMGIKTWYNERYIKDISRKIKDNLRSKQKTEGLIIRDYYGYVKDPEDKTKLKIDHNIAPIIKRIFKLYIDGNGLRRISNILNNEKVPTPSQYHNIRFKHSYKVAKSWVENKVQRILKDDIYIGTLRCGKTIKHNIKGKSTKVDSDKHFVHLNHHEPIISKEDFDLVQSILNNKRVRGVRASSNGINLFSGKLTCGDCGSYMVKNNREGAYICGNYHKHGKDTCTTHFISENDLIKIILEKLHEIVTLNNTLLEDVEKELINITNNNDITSALKDLENKYNLNIQKVDKVLTLVLENKIDNTTYKRMLNKISQENKLIRKQIDDLINYKKNQFKYINSIKSAREYILDLINSNMLKRSEVEILINNIIITQDDKVSKRGKKPRINVTIEWNTFIKNSIPEHSVISSQ